MADQVVVVGGGVLGAMHAVQARRQGMAVVHLEREAAARGASVRNFGLVWVSGRAAGAELDLAQRARTQWAELAALAPSIGLRAQGSLTVAADDAELGLLKEAAARPDAAEREFELLDPRATAELNPALRGEFSGALRCRRDAIVEPRQVPAALRDYLLAGGAGYDLLPGREAVEAGPHAVRDHTGEWHRGELVVLCPGAAHTGIAGRHLAGYARPPLRRVRLQMLQTEPFAGRLTTAVAGGDSLRYYPAFLLPGRARLAPQAPVTAATAALLLVQRLDGSLTIGDTHSYDEPFDFDLDEAPSTICWRGPSGCSARRCRPPLSLGRGLPPGQRHRRAVPPIAGRARRHSGDWGRRTGDDLLTRDRRGNVRDRHLRTL